LQLTGTHVIQGTPEQVWAALNNPDVLARCAPGVKSLEATGPDQYKALVELAVGPVKGNYQGKISITDKDELRSMTLKVEAKAPVGVVMAVGKLNLTGVEEGKATRLDWEGTPQLAGMLASVGARLIGGVAKAQADLFFEKLQREIQPA
jgi:hypothetical protein